MSESFEVQTRVRQGYLLSPFLFPLVIDWIMKITTTGSNNCIQWTLWTQLDVLDFADDLALLSHNHSEIQDRTTKLETTSCGVELKISSKKTNLMKINTSANKPVTEGGEQIYEVDSFSYLSSPVDKKGGPDKDVPSRVGKARAAFINLEKIWSSKEIATPTKIHIFNSNEKSILLCGSETWRMTKKMLHEYLDPRHVADGVTRLVNVHVHVQSAVGACIAHGCLEDSGKAAWVVRPLSLRG
ncbi:uncharacterized protein LOC143284330 [Babylonia areolata]|uniref:uncharacterized protein LOC143284330 n=1 Tax=Babylonia areolata TaxID=304850 RepID=UPI003FD6A3BC